MAVDDKVEVIDVVKVDEIDEERELDNVVEAVEVRVDVALLV